MEPLPPKRVPRLPAVSSGGNAEDSERYLEALLRASPDILFRLDREGVIRDYRAGDVSFLGLPPARHLGRKMQEVLPAEIAGEYQKAFRETRETGRMTILTHRYDASAGARWFEIRLVSAAGSETIAVVRDVTEHKRAEERLQRQLDRMAALRAIDAAILSSFNIKVTLSVVLREIVGQLKVDAADVLLFNPANSSLELAAEFGFRHPIRRGPLQRIGEGYAGRAIMERQAIHVSDAGGAHFADSPREGFVSYHAIPLLMKGEVKGVLEIRHRAPRTFAEEEAEFLDMIAGRIALAIEDSRLFETLQRSNVELVRAHDSILEGWARAMDLCAREADGHSLRVAERTVSLARQMGVPEPDLIHVRRGALLHNLCKLGIPDSILRKPGPLTEEEWEIVRQQPRLVYDLLSPIESLRPALNIPFCCQERWDGSGYPRGLKGKEIPLAARILAAVDAWEALLASRPDRPAHSPAEARRLLLAGAGTRFDPAVVKALLAGTGRRASK